MQPHLLDHLGGVGVGEEPRSGRCLEGDQRSDFCLIFLRLRPPGPKL